MLSLLVVALLPIQASGLANVATGRHSTFIVDATGRVQATGRNNKGQLGINSTAVTTGLTEVVFPMEEVGVNETQPDAPKIKQVAAGAFHTLFLTMDGRVYAAGSNQFGQLATGNNIDSMTPVKLDFGSGPNDTSTVIAVAAGYGHSLFLMNDNTVRAAGANSAGQLGDGTTMHRNTAVRVCDSVDCDEVSYFMEADMIAAGYDFSYIKNTAGIAFAFGQNLGGQLGAGSGRSSMTPIPVSSNIIAFSAGESHGLFLKESGHVLGTGANFDGQLGDNTVQHKMRAIELNYDDLMKYVGAGGDSSCFTPKHNKGLGSDLACTGSNRDGQLGLDEVVSVKTLNFVPGVNFVDSIAIADHHGVVATHPEDVYAMGSNDFGELGDKAATRVPLLFTKIQLPSTAAPEPTPAPPTYPPEPSPAPTPPTESPTPGPTPGRDINGDGNNNWAVYLWGGGIAVGLLLLVFAIARGQGNDDEEGGNGVQLTDDAEALEEMRAQMSS